MEQLTTLNVPKGTIMTTKTTKTTKTTATKTTQKQFDRLCVVVDDPTRDALAILARYFACNISATVRYAILNAPVPTTTDNNA